MSLARPQVRLSSQDGYTVLEMIITMALTGLLSGAIFSSFIVLDRIQTAWQERDQARAIGVLAEQPLLRDVQAYKVVGVGKTLVLQGVSTNGTPIQVSYAVLSSKKGDVLNRAVTPCLQSICQGTVAHGVRTFNVTCAGTPPTLLATMSVDAISTSSSAQSVTVNPGLKLTPRNLQTCP